MKNAKIFLVAVLVVLGLSATVQAVVKVKNPTLATCQVACDSNDVFCRPPNNAVIKIDYTAQNPTATTATCICTTTNNVCPSGGNMANQIDEAVLDFAYDYMTKTSDNAPIDFAVDYIDANTK